MNGNFTLPCECGCLRPLQVEDIHDLYISGLNNPEVNRFLVDTRQAQQTRESVESFVRSNLESTSAILFGIWEEGKRNHCGTVRLHDIHRGHQIASIGVCIFDTASWGKNLGSQAIRAVTQWGFEVQKLRWIEAGFYAENSASEKAFQGAGYTSVCDFDGKYLFEGRPAKVRIFAAKNPKIP